jgi:hypothetical protein
MKLYIWFVIGLFVLDMNCIIVAWWAATGETQRGLRIVLGGVYRSWLLCGQPKPGDGRGVPSSWQHRAPAKFNQWLNQALADICLADICLAGSVFWAYARSTRSQPHEC